MSPPIEKIILGLDPGTVVTGYAIIKTQGQKVDLLQYGVIRLNKYSTHELRLKKIFERISSIVNEFLPDEMAIEAPFYGKNVQSMLKLGRAQGIAMAAALHRDVPVAEYAPREVKQSVTGNGASSKMQVAKMLMNIFRLEQKPKLLDATDALAVALCHHYKTTGHAAIVGKKKSWEDFIAKNLDRIAEWQIKK